MIEDRRADELDALEAARRESVVALPRGTWRELETRAAMLGIEAELLADGAELRLAADLPRGRGARQGMIAAVPAGWRGQGLVEYGLILALTALFTVLILFVFGGTLAEVLDAIGDAIDAAG